MDKTGFAFVFARKGSKGLPRKNIRALGERPLIEWTLDYLCASTKVDRVCISTDDEVVIGKYTEKYSSKILMHKRPDELASDYATTEDVLVDACNAMQKFIKQQHFGVYMQITEPFRPDDILDLCIDKYTNGNFDSVFAAKEYHKNFWSEEATGLKRVSNQHDFTAPRQKKKSIIREDTGICLVADIDLFFQGKRIGFNPSYILYDHPGSLIDIHSEADLQFAEDLIKLGVVD